MYVHQLKASGKITVGKQFPTESDAERGERMYFSPANRDKYSRVWLLKNLGTNRGQSVQEEVREIIETLKAGDKHSQATVVM